tara:strand:+ start:349 stop:501 length:153 start_codon:yes stop_codon:yes gene_type:complete
LGEVTVDEIVASKPELKAAAVVAIEAREVIDEINGYSPDEEQISETTPEP